MRKYLDYMTIGIKEHLVYPSAVCATLFSKILYLYLQFCIWTALFSSGSIQSPALGQTETLRYIVMATVVSTILECNVIDKINAQIQSGDIAVALIRPIGFQRMLLARHLGDTAVKMLCYMLPLIILVKVCTKMPLLCVDQLGFGILSVFLAYGIQFFYSLIIGFLAFWLIVTWPIHMFMGAIYKLLSGVWIPVAMFPAILYRITLFLPFRAIYAIPVSILTDRMERKAVWQSIGVQIIWLMVLYLLTQFLWHIGRHKLVVQGG